MSTESPDYREDWKRFWAVQYQGRASSQLRSVARRPADNALSIDVREIAPDDEKYDFKITYGDLIEKPDSVLDDAQEGFRDFVSESDIDVAEMVNYDIIPLHIVGMSRVNPGSAQAFSFDELHDRQDKLSYIRAIPRNVKDDLQRVPASIGYRCPTGHQTRVTYPIYSHQRATVCPEESCTNTATQISNGTTSLDVVKFEVEFDGSTLDCLAYGTHSDERRFKNLKSTSEKIQLTGILRERVADGQVKPVFEALYLSDSLR